MMNDILDPPAAHGEPLFTAVLKKQATDFRVFEELDISFSGDGEHLFVQIEKTAMNTDEVVASLQKCYGVSSADVGLSGLKDRHSVSTQWFSVRTPENSEQFEKRVIDFNEEQQALWGKSDGYLKSMRLLRSERHSRKLRRGAHRRNNFVITLREVKTIQAANTQLQEQVDKRVRVLCELGFPNYIGSQRFGNHGQNFQRAKQWFSNPRKRTSRQQRSIWLSASRSALFNKVCAARVRAGNWTRLLDGEPAMLDGSSSFFVTGVEGEESLVMVENVQDEIQQNRGKQARGKQLEANRLEANRLEANRLEANRLEANRVEANRVEANRLEANRLEANRLEANRVEANRVEANRVEANGVQVGRVQVGRVQVDGLEVDRVVPRSLNNSHLRSDFSTLIFIPARLGGDADVPQRAVSVPNLKHCSYKTAQRCARG